MSNTFEQAYAHVRKWEGGFSDHPADSGGKTIFGITRKYNQKEFDAIQGMLKAGNKQGAEALTRDFYHKLWVSSGAHLLDVKSPALAFTHFDMAVNAGQARAKKILEQSGEDASAYNDNRESFYRSISKGKNSVFLKGWLNRLNDAREFDPNDAPAEFDSNVDFNNTAAPTTGSANTSTPPQQEQPSLLDSLKDLLSNNNDSSQSAASERLAALRESLNQEDEDTEEIEEVVAGEETEENTQEDLEEEVSAEEITAEESNEDDIQASDDALLALETRFEKTLQALNNLKARLQERRAEQEDRAPEVDEVLFEGDIPLPASNVVDAIITQDNLSAEEVRFHEHLAERIADLLPDLHEDLIADLGSNGANNAEFASLLETQHFHIYNQVKIGYEETYGTITDIASDSIDNILNDDVHLTLADEGDASASNSLESLQAVNEVPSDLTGLIIDTNTQEIDTQNFQEIV